MFMARCTQSRGYPVQKSLLVLEISGGVGLLIIFLALQVRKERLLK